MSKKHYISRVVGTYKSPVIRLYCFLRFQILRQRFLDEIEQYLPEKGTVMDIGCGFGLFSLYFALSKKELRFIGIDRNARRIATAKETAATLGIDRVHYQVADVADYAFKGGCDAAYMLDIIHHIPPEAVAPLIAQIRDILTDDGCLIVKDVSDKPFYKRWFTYLLDKAMDYKTPVHYWSIADLTALLQDNGFVVHAHQMMDYLPYPHVIYICRKAQ